MSVLKIMATNFLKVNSEIQPLLEEYKQIEQYVEPELLFKKSFRKKCHMIDLHS